MAFLRILWWLVRSRFLRRMLVRLVRLLGLRRVVRALFLWPRRLRAVTRFARG